MIFFQNGYQRPGGLTHAGFPYLTHSDSIGARRFADRAMPQSSNYEPTFLPPSFAIGPPTTLARVNNLRTTDGTSVSMAIHNDNQLHPAHFGKAAHAG
jgi:hypothetical protein